ncbi:cell division protein ZapD [Ferrimonas aestuarii]|uniref:Cell division protein ZapD n=1 Tax=Ferrimonas aestuarii TaxID=2569539 RepID=A0A4U1BQQ5_9GAMM|nr:cell division protein ZapD [Ferrimonas aestuarii]TKB53715.1 cell division protein ZapD [Ferrimonas aestuarii]
MSQSNLFEHPLNERTRLYLRVEQLTQQLRRAVASGDRQCHLDAFRPLFDLAELLDRSDLKQDLLKQVELSSAQLKKWQSLPGVDQQQLQQLIDRLGEHCQQLHQMDKPGQTLKQDRFLCQVKQRLNAIGGLVGFDLPRLQHWLYQPEPKRRQQLEQWLGALAPMPEVIGQQLQLIRECSPWQGQLAKQGQFLHNDPNSLALLRIRLDTLHGVYPVVSGHRSRFSINMMNDNASTECRDIPFEMALAVETP